MRFRKTMSPASMTIRTDRRSFTLCLHAPIANPLAQSFQSRSMLTFLAQLPDQGVLYFKIVPR
jgi:hypothetical protein